METFHKVVACLNKQYLFKLFFTLYLVLCMSSYLITPTTAVFNDTQNITGEIPGADQFGEEVDPEVKSNEEPVKVETDKVGEEVEVKEQTEVNEANEANETNETNETNEAKEQTDKVISDQNDSDTENPSGNDSDESNETLEKE